MYMFRIWANFFNCPWSSESQTKGAAVQPGTPVHLEILKYPVTRCPRRTTSVIFQELRRHKCKRLQKTEKQGTTPIAYGSIADQFSCDGPPLLPGCCRRPPRLPFASPLPRAEEHHAIVARSRRACRPPFVESCGGQSRQLGRLVAVWFLLWFLLVCYNRGVPSSAVIGCGCRLKRGNS